MSKQKIYLMKNEIGLYKIGISNNPEKRARDISNNCGVPTSLIKHWDSYNAFATEQRLHKVFAEKRKSGEWFKLVKKDILSIDTIINDIDKLIPHVSYVEPTIASVKPKCQSLYAMVTRSFKLESIEDFIKIRDYQYELLSKQYKHNVEDYYETVDELVERGYYVPYVWQSCAVDHCSQFGGLYKPSFSYLQREYPICLEKDKVLLDTLFTKSYIEDLDSLKAVLTQQLEKECLKLKTFDKEVE